MAGFCMLHRCVKISDYPACATSIYKSGCVTCDKEQGYCVPNEISRVVAAGSISAEHYGEATPVADAVLRVLARNPKDYTDTGTNTYVVGDEAVWIIDPGPADEHHIAAVLRAVAGRPVLGICVTHTHMDHSPAAAILKQKTGAKTYGFGALPKDILEQTTEDVDCRFVPDVRVSHGQLLGAGKWRLKALHTPGHFPNHLCFSLPEYQLLFSGDHVMGWSTTVIVPPLGNLQDYMDSLDVLEACEAALMLPSHGDIVAAPSARIEAVRQHRKMRHRQVRECLERGIVEPEEIVAHIYDGLSPCLLKAAKGSVLAHMELLVEEGLEAGVMPTETANFLAV